MNSLALDFTRPVSHRETDFAYESPVLCPDTPDTSSDTSSPTPSEEANVIF